MTKTLGFSVIAAAALLAGCSGGADDGTTEQPVIEKITAPADGAWTSKVAKTAAGGMAIGNPDAPIKVIEFASLTCGACAQFSTTGAAELKKEFVDTGRVSLELRNFIRDPLDATAATLTRCAGPQRFFPLTEQVFAAQAQLIGAAQAAGAAGETAMALPPAQRFGALAKAWGLDQFFMARGMTEAEIATCLGNVKNIEEVEALTNASVSEFQVSGTPTFVINGKVADGVTSWPALRERLTALGAR